jgi:site-specific DNA recombinase
MSGGPALYGYAWVGSKHDTFTVDKETAPIVKRLYDDAARGVSLRSLAMQLNREGVPTPTQTRRNRGELSDKQTVSALWSRQMVYILLENPTYYGKRVAYRAKRTGKVSKRTGKTYYHGVLRAEDDTARILQPCPAIVSEETWRLAQAQISRNKGEATRNSKHAEEALLRAGYAECGHCGARMTAYFSHGAVHYHCNRRKGYEYDTSKICSGVSYRVTCADVDEGVWRMALAIAQDTGRLEALIQRREDKEQAKIDSLIREAANAEDELQEQLTQQANLVQHIARESEPSIVALYREELARVTKTIQSLTGKGKRARFTADMMAPWHAVSVGLRSLVHEKHGDHYSYAEKRQVLALLGVKVKMYREDSEYNRTHGKRWEFTFNADDGIVNGTSRCACSSP